MQNHENNGAAAIFTLIRKNSTVIIILVTSCFLNYIFNVILARNLTPEAYGDIALVLRIITFLIPFSIVGLSFATLRYLPIYSEKEEFSKSHGFLKWALGIFSVSTVIAVVIGTLLITMMLLLHLNDIRPFESYHPIIFAVWIVPLGALMVLLSAVLQALKHYHASILPTRVIYYVLSSTFILLIVMLVDKLNVYHVLISIGLAYLFTIAVLLIITLRNIPSDTFQQKPFFQKNLWFKTSMQMTLNTVAFYTIPVLDIFLLELFGKSEKDVGMFATILVILYFLQVPAISINLIANPLISPLVEGGNRIRLQQTANTINTIKLTLTFLLGIIILIFGRHFLGHFNPLFKIAYPALAITTIGFLIKYCGDMASMLLLYGNHQVKLTYIMLTQIILVILLDIFLIPRFHILGAAISLLIGYAFTTGISIFVASQKFQVRSLFFI